MILAFWCTSCAQVTHGVQPLDLDSGGSQGLSSHKVQGISAEFSDSTTITRLHVWLWLTDPKDMKPDTPPRIHRDREMSTNLFCTNYLNTPRGPGHPGDIPGCLLRKSRKTYFRGRARTFRPPPFRVDDPHPTRQSPDPKRTLIFVLFFFLPENFWFLS